MKNYGEKKAWTNGEKDTKKKLVSGYGNIDYNLNEIMFSRTLYDFERSRLVSAASRPEPLKKY